MGYQDRLFDQLKGDEIGKLIQYMPSTKKVKGHPDMHGPGDPRYLKKKRADAGQIDFYNYGGEKSKETKYEEMWTGGFGKDKDEKNQTRKDWQKVARELGINQVDSEDEVRRMIEHVRGYSQKSEPAVEEKPVEPIATRPNDEKPKEVQDAVQEYEDTKLNKDGNTTPRLSDIIKTDLAGNPTSNPMMDAITHGDDLNDWYSKKFIPHLEAEANATAHEIGDTSRFFLDKWVFEPPKLGDPKEVFKYYADQISGDDDDD